MPYMVNMNNGNKMFFFSGGTDLTPYYFNEADTVHFHETLKAACDEHDLTYYPRYEIRHDICLFLSNKYL